MKILVPIKRVVDPYVKVRVKEDGSGVVTEAVKMSMNPFDEIALEEAIRLKEQGTCSEVILLSIGTTTAQETLRHGLALGADRALLIETTEAWCSLSIAKIIQKMVLEEQIDLVFMGKQSIDGDNNQTPQMLAGLLDWPQATFASKIQLEGGALTVTREVDTGLETLLLQLPAVVSVDLRLNTPRYASLPNIMLSKKKPLVIKPLPELLLLLKPHREILKVTPPGKKSPSVMVKSVEELVDKLRHEAKVLEG